MSKAITHQTISEVRELIRYLEDDVRTLESYDIATLLERPATFKSLNKLLGNINFEFRKLPAQSYGKLSRRGYFARFAKLVNKLTGETAVAVAYKRHVDSHRRHVRPQPRAFTCSD